jgi:hypothetical protein
MNPYHGFRTLIDERTEKARDVSEVVLVWGPWEDWGGFKSDRAWLGWSAGSSWPCTHSPTNHILAVSERKRPAGHILIEVRKPHLRRKIFPTGHFGGG